MMECKKVSEHYVNLYYDYYELCFMCVCNLCETKYRKEATAYFNIFIIHMYYNFHKNKSSVLNISLQNIQSLSPFKIDPSEYWPSPLVLAAAYS